jgi:ferrous iron transport protein B
VSQMASNASPDIVALVGNPNCGKSTLFTALTGADAQVGNYPGTTVERFESPFTLPDGRRAVAVDLPGAYSLAASSPDEMVALQGVLGMDGYDSPSLIVVVADAPRLARSLYLTLQLLELELNVVVALNLMDEARAHGLGPNVEALSDLLGVPVVATVARTGEGIDRLRQVMANALAHPAAGSAPIDLSWSDELEEDVGAVTEVIPPEWATKPSRRRALARWALLSGKDSPKVAEHPVLQRAVEVARTADVASDIVGARYIWVDSHMPSLVAEPSMAPKDDRIDSFLLHPVYGTVVFFAVMYVVFQALFAWSGPLIDGIDGAFAWLGGQVAGLFPSDGPLAIVGDLIVEGLIGGVGAVLVFVPQIALLFLFIAILEDCGYLARAAHLMDRLLRSAGLPGQAFVPLLSGFACAVPAIMATRTMPRARDRLLTMMVLPLTTCSARLPVYSLVIAAVFPETIPGWPLQAQASVLFAMYLFSTVVTVVAAVVLGKTMMRGKQHSAVLELPPYRVPHLPTVMRSVRSRTSDFVREAGRIILVATVILWALLAFPRYEPQDVVPPDVLASTAVEDLDAVARSYQLEASYGGRLGRLIEPAIAPLGYDWKIGVGLIGSFAAREVFVSTMGLVYGVGGEVDESSPRLHERIQAEVRADGSPQYTPLVGASLMVFFALAMQCLSTLAVLKRETQSWRWPVFATVYMLALAWLAAFAVYQGGQLLGLS